MFTVKKMKFNFEKISITLFSFFVVFIFIPTQLYYPNAVQWNDAFPLKIIALSGLLLGLCMSFLLVLFYKVPRLKMEKFVFFIFLLGVYFLLSDVYAPLQLARLDGAIVKSDEPLLYTIIELIIFIALISIGVFFNNSKNYKYAVFLSQMGVVAISLYFLFAIFRTTGGDIAANDDSLPTVEARLNAPNVYHILLDEMQTDYFLKVVEAGNYTSYFDGFTVFKNNISNYPYTQSSTASYLTGTSYNGGDFPSWIAESKYGLFNTVKSAGYELTVYGKPIVIKAEEADTYKTQDEIFLKYSGVLHPLLKEFVRIWVARVAPNAFTNSALDVGGILGDNVSKVFSKPQNNAPKTITDGLEPYTGVYMFRDVIQSEKYRSGEPNYLYFHVLLPHGPYVIDDNCNYTKPQGDVANSYLQQAGCSVRLLSDFMNELKKEDKYNDALIIVHGDHGSGWAGFLNGVDENGEYVSSNLSSDQTPYRPEILPWSKQQVESRSMALLMIKPPGALSELKVNNSSTQLLDLYPTILDFLGIAPSVEFEGKSLMNCLTENIACEELNTRDRYFNYYTVGESPTKDVEKLKVGFNELGRPEFLSSQINKVILSLLPDNIVDFSSSGSGGDFLKDGWSTQETHHRWSIGDKSNLTVKLPNTKGESLLLRLYANAYLGGNLPYQTIGVYVNGQKVAVWQMTGLDWYEAKIPKDVVGEGILDIVFTISNPTAPCEVNESVDCRKLGMAVVQMQIDIIDN